MKIVLVDDSDAERMALAAMLRELGHEVVEGDNGRDAVTLYHEHKPDLVLLDVIMPVMDGYEATHAIRVLDEDWTPIIFLSARSDPASVVAGIEAGADDYLPKSVDKIVLTAKMDAMQRIAIMRRRLIDVSNELETANKKLLNLANMDGLTGLLNRRSLDETLSAETSRCRRNKTTLSIILLDIDFFKRYNDTYGHVAGDSCLKKVAKVLKRGIQRPADIVARYGGEEFCVVLPETTENGALHVAEALKKAIVGLNIPHQGNDALECVSCSFGVASRVPGRQFDFDQLVREADEALYQAKRSGRNRCLAFSQLERTNGNV